MASADDAFACRFTRLPSIQELTEIVADVDEGASSKTRALQALVQAVENKTVIGVEELQRVSDPQQRPDAAAGAIASSGALPALLALLRDGDATQQELVMRLLAKLVTVAQVDPVSGKTTSLVRSYAGQLFRDDLAVRIVASLAKAEASARNIDALTELQRRLVREVEERKEREAAEEAARGPYESTQRAAAAAKQIFDAAKEELEKRAVTPTERNAATNKLTAAETALEAANKAARDKQTVYQRAQFQTTLARRAEEKTEAAIVAWQQGILGATSPLLSALSEKGAADRFRPAAKTRMTQLLKAVEEARVVTTSARLDTEARAAAALASGLWRDGARDVPGTLMRDEPILLVLEQLRSATQDATVVAAVQLLNALLTRTPYSPELSSILLAPELGLQATQAGLMHPAYVLPIVIAKLRNGSQAQKRAAAYLLGRFDAMVVYAPAIQLAPDMAQLLQPLTESSNPEDVKASKSAWGNFGVLGDWRRAGGQAGLGGWANLPWPGWRKGLPIEQPVVAASSETPSGPTEAGDQPQTEELNEVEFATRQETVMAAVNRQSTVSSKRIAPRAVPAAA